MFTQPGSGKMESAIDSKIASVMLAGALSIFPNENVEAMEMPPKATWSQGIEAAHESVMNGEVEYGFTFIKMPGASERSFWPTMTKGGQYSVQNNSEAIAIGLSEKLKSGKVEKICFGHSHPMWKQFSNQFKEGDYRWKTLPNPPSVHDIKSMHEIIQTTSELGTAEQSLTFFVVDPRGVWYFSPSKSEKSAEVIQDFIENDIPPGSEKKFSEFSRLFQDNLNPETDIRLTPSYNEWLANYEQILGARLRFVPLNEVSSEPPCAGADFDRGMK